MNDAHDNAQTDKEMYEKLRNVAAGKLCGAMETGWVGMWDCTLPKGHGGDYHETHSNRSGKVIHRWHV